MAEGGGEEETGETGEEVKEKKISRKELKKLKKKVRERGVGRESE